jgi:hypothetical protein
MKFKLTSCVVVGVWPNIIRQVLDGDEIPILSMKYQLPPQTAYRCTRRPEDWKFAPPQATSLTLVRLPLLLPPAARWTRDVQRRWHDFYMFASINSFVAESWQQIGLTPGIGKLEVIMPHFKEISNPNRVHRLKRAVVWWSQRINSSPLLNSDIWLQSCARTFMECRSLAWIGVAVTVKIIVKITILKHPRLF